nr:MAG TPA: hypothetical protein [Caudoviricetes sp.]
MRCRVNTLVSSLRRNLYVTESGYVSIRHESI